MADTQRAASYVAECFWPGVSKVDLEAAEARAGATVDALSSEGESVRYLGSLFFPADEVVFFQFEAASEDLARRVSQRARIPFERIVESVGVSVRPGSRERPKEAAS